MSAGNHLKARLAMKRRFSGGQNLKNINVCKYPAALAIQSIDANCANRDS